MVDCLGDPLRWREERRRAFPGVEAERFWREQEGVARRLWPLAGRVPVWPPEGAGDLLRLGAFGARSLWRDPACWGWPPTGAPRWPGGCARGGGARGMGSRIRWPGGGAPACAASVTRSSLITAQATAERAAWLYGAVALDLARHGAAHVAGGAGALAETLLERYRELGGRIHFRTRAQAVEVDGGGRVVAVRDQRGGRWPEAGAADAVVANLLPGNLATLLGESCSSALPAPPGAPPAGLGGLYAVPGGG